MSDVTPSAPADAPIVLGSPSSSGNSEVLPTRPRRMCPVLKGTYVTSCSSTDDQTEDSEEEINKTTVVTYGTTELNDLKEQHTNFDRSNIMKVSVFLNTAFGIQGGQGCDEEGSECSKMESFESCPMTSKCINLLKIRKPKVAVGDSKVAGNGVFARELIKTNTVIIIYVGEMITNEEYGERQKVYKKMGISGVYGYENGSGYTTDATLYGNLARFVNHSCQPNVEANKWSVPEYPRGYPTIVFTAKEDIAEGHELFVNYNFDYHPEKSIRCFCNAPNCTNFFGKGLKRNQIYVGEIITNLIQLLPSSTLKQGRFVKKSSSAPESSRKRQNSPITDSQTVDSLVKKLKTDTTVARL